MVREFQGKCYRFVDNAVLQISADCNLQGGIFAEIRNIDIHDFLIDTVSDIGFQWSRAYFAAHKQIGAGPWMWTYGINILIFFYMSLSFLHHTLIVISVSSKKIST